MKPKYILKIFTSQIPHNQSLSQQYIYCICILDISPVQKCEKPLIKYGPRLDSPLLSNLAALSPEMHASLIKYDDFAHIYAAEKNKSS